MKFHLRLQVFLYVFLPFISISQVLDTNGIHKYLSNSDAVYLKNQVFARIKIKHGRPIIEESNHEEVFFTKSNPYFNTSKVIYFTGKFEELKDVNSYTTVYRKHLNSNNSDLGENSENGEIAENIVTKVKNFQYKDETSNGIFYDDLKSCRFSLVNLQANAVATTDYMLKVNEPELLNKFYFSNGNPVLKSEYQISFPKTVGLKWRVFNTTNFKFSESEKDGIVTYKWSMSNIDKVKYSLAENDELPRSYFLPHIIVRITNYIGKAGDSIPVLSNPKQFYKWGFNLLSQMEKKDNNELKNFTLKLIENSKSDSAKARVIFQWVQKNIDYIAFESGWTGFIPDCDINVFNKKYGDCKGMANLIVSMLRFAGLNAHHVWLGTRDLPYKFEEVPAPNSCNHMIASVELNGQFVFLDATNKYVPFGFPTGFTQGKEAMIEISPDLFKIVKVPIVPSRLNLYSDTTTLYIDSSGLVSGHSLIQMHGLQRSNFTYNYLELNSKDYFKLFSKCVEKGNEKMSVSNLFIDDPLVQSDVLKAQYDFTLPDYLRVNGNETYLNLNLAKVYNNLIIDTIHRFTDKPFSFLTNYEFVTKFKTPNNIEAVILPTNSNFEDEKFRYSVKYERLGNDVLMKTSIEVNQLYLMRRDFSKWNKMIKQLSSAYKTNLILKKQL